MRGIFLGTLDEINWFLYGIKSFFPEAHNNFTNQIPSEYKNDILNWYYKQLNCSDDKTVKRSASLWNQYEISCSTLRYVDRKSSSYESLAIAKIETHYFVNNCFLKENYILDNLKNICKIRCNIIQGRHDVICPPYNALLLAKKMKNSKITIVEDGGHSAFEGNMFDEVVKSLNDIY